MTVETPARYDRFEQMPIAGRWRTGRSDTSQPNLDPYTGDTLLPIRLATEDDLNEAYRGAADAAPAWAEAAPAARASVMSAAAQIMQARKDEIVDWLIREAGSTRVKAESEWAATRADFLEASSIPH